MSFPSYPPPPSHHHHPSPHTTTSSCPPTSTDARAGPTSHHSTRISINSNEAGSGFPRHRSQTTAGRPCPGATPWRRWPGFHAGRTDRQSGRQTDMRPCDFSVILESILSNFAICPGGNDGSVELICRLLALLQLYRTSFWSGMQARVCSPVELRGVSIQEPGSLHSITGSCVSDIQRHVHILSQTKQEQ